MPIEVRKPGLSTTVQDAGRTGYYHLGIPPSGRARPVLARGRRTCWSATPRAAALECVYMGPELAFTEDAVVAVTGAEMAPKVNGEERPLWESFPVGAGDVLNFGYLTAGARAYIAVAGGIDVPEVLGSRSTYGLGALGGLEGRPLREGDVLPVGTAPRRRARRPRPCPPSCGRRSRRTSRCGSSWASTTTASPTAAGRRSSARRGPSPRSPTAIGFRYKGAELETVEREPPFGAGQDPSNIVDAPYPIGSIQVPGAWSRSSCTATRCPAAAT